MYDEHQPPQSGPERKIMKALGTESAVLPKELIDRMKQQGLPESEVRGHIWSLIGRGFIELTLDRQLRGHAKAISPAPVDFV